jgi:hypothetical protein
LPDAVLGRASAGRRIRGVDLETLVFEVVQQGCKPRPPTRPTCMKRSSTASSAS